MNRDLGEKEDLFWSCCYGKQAGIWGGGLFVLAGGYGKWGEISGLNKMAFCVVRIRWNVYLVAETRITLEKTYKKIYN
ncbi:hypothetical protein ES703_123249 [subsurface metagenome]